MEPERPRLRFLHAAGTLNPGKLGVFRRLPTEELKSSLAPSGFLEGAKGWNEARGETVPETSAQLQWIRQLPAEQMAGTR